MYWCGGGGIIDHNVNLMYTPGDIHIYSPTVQYLKDMLNDENYDKYYSYSDINICSATSLGTSTSPSPVYYYTPPHQAPKPPPNFPIVRVTYVPTHKYLYDEGIPISTTYTSDNDDNNPSPIPVPDIYI